MVTFDRGSADRRRPFSAASASRGITGLETAIILIAFVVVASVFAFTVLTTGIFASERSKETVFAGLEEAKSTLEPRGSVIAYSGTTGGASTVFKATLVVSNAVAGEAIDLTPPYTANDSGIDPDFSTGAEYKTVISYTDENQHLSDVPWTVDWLGDASTDHLLEQGEKAEITVWLLRRDNAVAIDSTDGVLTYTGPDANGASGIQDSTNVLGANDQFTIELKPDSGSVLTIQRQLSARLDTVIDLK